MSEYRVEYDLKPMVDEIAARIQHRVDQAALDKAADTLAEFGYVKVVRCRDCKHYRKLNDFGLCHPLGIVLADMGNGFCWLGKRKEGGDGV